MNRLRQTALFLLVTIALLCVLLFGAVETKVLEIAVIAVCALGTASLLPAVIGRSAMPRDSVLLSAAVLAAAAIATAPWSINSFLTLEWVVRIVTYAVVYGVAAHVTPSRRTARIAIIALVGIAFGAALYGLFITLSGREVVLWARKVAYRDSLTGTFINRNHFASYLVLHLYVALGLFAQAQRRSRLLLIAPLAAALLALPLTLSRGGLLAAVAALPLFIWLLASEQRRRLRLLGLAAALAFAALLATSWPRLKGRIEASYELGEEPSAAARLSIWRSTLRAFRERPLIGHGPGTFASFYPRYREVGISRLVSFAHQDYLEHLAEAGCLGLLLAAAGVAAVARSLRRSLSSTPDRSLIAGIAAGSLAVAFHAAVDFPLKIPAIPLSLAALLGLAHALAPTSPRLPRASRLVAGLAAIALILTAVRAGTVWLGDRHLRQARAAFQKPDWDTAAVHYQRSIDIDAQNPKAWEGLAQTEANRAKFRIRKGLDVRKRFAAEALDHLAEAERRDPLVADYNLQRAWLFNFLGRHDEAAAEYDLAIADDPANTNVLFHAASFRLHRGDVASGLELIARAIRAWPKFFGGKVGEFHHLVGDPDRLLAVIPDDQPFLMFQYSMHLLDRERDQEAAEKVFRAAAERADWRQDWLIQYAGTLASRFSPAEALSLYGSVPETHRSAAVRLEVAKLYNATGRRAECIEELLHATRRFPADRDTLRFLVEVAGDRPEVRAAVDRYRSEAGPDAGYHTAAGLLSLAVGELRAARSSFESALEVQPDDPHARHAAIRVYRQLAEQARARGDEGGARELDLLAKALEDRP